jgi:long-chain fatty acid transport protein
MTNERFMRPVRLIPALVFGFVVGYAHDASASGFQLIEQNASGLGNAYAGSAAVAENASTVFFNPAGMTQLQDREISAGAVAVKARYDFSNNDSSTGGLTGNGTKDRDWIVVPNAYMSWALNKDLYLGLGISAPFGLKTDYSVPWTGAAQSTKFAINTLNVNPSLAYRVNQAVSLGFGLNWQKIDAEYLRLAGIDAGTTNSVAAKMKLSGDAWGWNAGALFTLSPATKVGVSYRSAIKFNTTGLVGLSNDGTADGIATMAALNGQGASSDLKADLTLPGTFIMSVAQKLSEQWEMLGDVSRTGWSSIPKVDIVRTSNVANGALAQTLDTNFRNTWRVALGATYKVNDAWKAKFGISYDQTPTRDPEHRLSSLPDNNRTWLSFGGQWKADKQSVLDFGVAYLYFKESSINNDQTTGQAVPMGVVNGSYKDSAWLLGTQYSRSF